MSELWEAIARSATGDAATDADGGVQRTFVFTEEFPGFMGHFPGHPVLPAMIQMMAAAGIWSHGPGGARKVRGALRARFLMPITPGMTVTVHARPLGPDAAEIRVMAEERLTATFTLIFEKTA